MKKLALIILSSVLIFNSVMAAPLLALAAPTPPKPTPSSVPTSSTSSWYNQGFTDWLIKLFI